MDTELLSKMSGELTSRLVDSALGALASQATHVASFLILMLMQLCHQLSILGASELSICAECHVRVCMWWYAEQSSCTCFEGSQLERAVVSSL
jgi:hypothetical protein